MLTVDSNITTPSYDLIKRTIGRERMQKKMKSVRCNFMNSKGSKVASIILPPSAIESIHSGLIRQFELYAIITQPIALMSVTACLVNGRLCLFT